MANARHSGGAEAQADRARVQQARRRTSIGVRCTHTFTGMIPRTPATCAWCHRASGTSRGIGDGSVGDFSLLISSPQNTPPRHAPGMPTTPNPAHGETCTYKYILWEQGAERVQAMPSLRMRTSQPTKRALETIWSKPPQCRAHLQGMVLVEPSPGKPIRHLSSHEETRREVAKAPGAEHPPPRCLWVVRRDQTSPLLNRPGRTRTDPCPKALSPVHSFVLFCPLEETACSL